MSADLTLHAGWLVIAMAFLAGVILLWTNDGPDTAP